MQLSVKNKSGALAGNLIEHEVHRVSESPKEYDHGSDRLK